MKAALFEKHLNPTFVETGTFEGDGVKSALLAGFKEVYSMETSKTYFAKEQRKFFTNTKVWIGYGDSKKDLYSLIKLLGCRITFWLDAHSNHGGKPVSRQSAILEELEQIGRHSIKDHTILVDDVRLFGTEFFDNITIKQVKKAILRINENYVFSYATIRPEYQNDVLVATVRM